MHLSYLFMLCGLLSFGALGVLHKVADKLSCRADSITAVLYTSSLLYLAVGLLTFKGDTLQSPPAVIWIAIPFGVFAGAAILAFQSGIRYGDISTSWLAINLSSGVPTLASILLYHERVSLIKAIALLLIPVAVFLLWKDRRQSEMRQRSNRV